MPANRFVALVKDRPCIQQRFHRAEDILHHPQLLVLQRHLTRREIHVRRQHPLAVVARFLLDFVLVNSELFASGAQVFAIPFVTHQRLVSLCPTRRATRPPRLRGRGGPSWLDPRSCTPHTGAHPRPRLLLPSAARDRPGRRFWDALPHSGRRAPPPPWLPSNSSCARPGCTSTPVSPLPPGSRR